MNLWRMHLRTAIGDVSKFCLDEKIVGMGWPVASTNPSKTEYLDQCRQIYPKRRKGSVEAFMNDINETDDLIWVRTGLGFYLGKVGEWRPAANETYKHHNIGSVRSYDWFKVGVEESVPGAVVSNFIKGPALRRVRDRHALAYSHYLYAKGKGTPIAKPEKGREGILELIGSDDLEDVVAIYLQRIEHCLMFPSTCKKGTKGVECFGVSLSDEKLIGWQVKTGSSTINEDAFAGFEGKVYLFQMANWPATPPKPPCIRLSADELRTFLLDPSNKPLMPKKIRNWLDYAQASDLRNTVDKE